MKYINLFLTILCVITLGCSVFFFVPNFQGKGSRQNQLDSLALYRGVVQSFLTLYPIQTISDGIQLSPDMELSSERGVKITLKDIIKQPTLVYRFASSNCSMCVEEQFQILKKMKDQLPERTILISSYLSGNAVTILKKTYQLEFDIFNILLLDIPMENQSNPYYFVIDPDMKCHNFFAVMTATPLLTQGYLDAISKKLNMTEK